MEFVLSEGTDAGFSMFNKVSKMINPLGLRLCKQESPLEATV